jgi:metal-dependent amidase/aminoacylase/carboxypeptidase family protein
MTKSELMQKVQATIDRRGEEIIALGEAIRRQPELGFKEFKTAKLVAQTFERMGLTPRTGLALTGVRADVTGRAGDGPTLALFGELDGLVVVGHPVADPRDRRRARLRAQRAGRGHARRGDGPARGGRLREVTTERVVVRATVLRVKRVATAGDRAGWR